MKFKSVPAEVAALFEAVLPKDARAERKQMFGMPCSFAAGYLYAGCFEDRLMLKLRAADRAEFLSLPGAEPFCVNGRTMSEYAFVPRAMHADRKALAAWMKSAFDYVCSLPPKPAKKKAAKASAKKATKAKPAAKRGPSKSTP